MENTNKNIEDKIEIKEKIFNVRIKIMGHSDQRNNYTVINENTRESSTNVLKCAPTSVVLQTGNSKQILNWYNRDKNIKSQNTEQIMWNTYLSLDIFFPVQPDNLKYHVHRTCCA